MKENIIGDKLRELIKSLGLTQDEFAEKIGINRTLLNRWLNNPNKPPSLKSLKKISKSVDKSIDFFLGNIGNAGNSNISIANQNDNSETIEIMKRYIQKLEEEIADLKAKNKKGVKK